MQPDATTWQLRDALGLHFEPLADGPIFNHCRRAQETTLDSVRSKVREETCVDDGKIHLVTARERHLFIEQSLHVQPCGILKMVDVFF